MSSLEFLAKNVDKAVEKACDELNLAPEKLKYDILSHGSSGIFGLAGVKKAKIRVHLPRNSEKEIADGQNTVSAKELIDEIFIGKTSSQESGKRDGSGSSTPFSFDDTSLELGRATLERIVASISPDAEISTEEKSGCLFFNIASGNAGILIGKKGQTLDAIQSLVEKIVNKHHPLDAKIQVQVDVEGYLENRKTNLEKLAGRLADKSKQIRKPISLGQMSAYDRKIVHLALKDDPDIRTKSKGEGYLRKLVIFPKKNNRKKLQSK
jgi:spoIIIJ-associated protein